MNQHRPPQGEGGGSIQSSSWYSGDNPTPTSTTENGERRPSRGAAGSTTPSATTGRAPLSEHQHEILNKPVATQHSEHNILNNIPNITSESGEGTAKLKLVHLKQGFGPSWAILGHLGHTRAILGHLGAMLDQVGAKLEPSWRQVGAKLGRFGAKLEPS